MPITLLFVLPLDVRRVLFPALSETVNCRAISPCLVYFADTTLPFDGNSHDLVVSCCIFLTMSSLSAPHSTSFATLLMCVVCPHVLAPRAHLPDYSLPSLLDLSCDHHCPVMGVPCSVPLATDCHSLAGNAFPFISPLSTRYVWMTG